MSSVGRGLSDAIAYGSGPDKFLVVYVREAPGSKANVYGKFISANGQSVGPEFVVGGGTESQQYPRVAYAPTTDSIHGDLGELGELCWGLPSHSRRSRGGQWLRRQNLQRGG